MNTDATTVRPDSQVKSLIKRLSGLVAVFHEPPHQKVNLTPFFGHPDHLAWTTEPTHR